MTLHDLTNWQKSFNIPVLKNNSNNSFLRLQDEMNQLFDHLYNGMGFGSGANAGGLGGLGNLGNLASMSAPAINLIENEKNFRVEAELPGLAPENVEVSLTDDTLTIQGEKKESKNEKGDNYLRQETSFGSFSRQIALPQSANAEKAEATFKNGVLSITIKKKADAIQKPKKLTIKKAA